MQRISTTVVGLVGERARACAEGLDRASNIRVELPDPAAAPLDRAAAAWQAAAGTHLPHLVHDADPLALVADAWVRRFDEQGPAGELEVAVRETLARWRARTIDLPDYYIVLDPGSWGATRRHWYLGLLHRAAPSRVVPVEAERLLGELPGPRPASLEVEQVFEGLHRVAEAQGTGSQARKLAGLTGLLERATPLEARYLVRTVTGTLRLGIGTATLLDALAEVHAGGRKQRLILERAWNICSDLSLVAATLVAGGLAEVGRLTVRAGNPVRPMLAQRLSEPAEILAKLGGRCAAEYKYDGIRVQATAPPTAPGAVHRRLERVSGQFPDAVKALDAGLGPREAILEGEVVAIDPASGELRPFQDVMFRRRKYGIDEAIKDVPVGLFCFELLYADGEDLTGLPYLERRARLEAVFQQAVADGCEGLICKSLSEAAGYQAGARGWLWIKLKRDYRSELADTLDLVCRCPGRPGPPRRHVRRPAAGRLRPGHRPLPGQLQEDAGLALRFPRFTGRWSDDKAATDATTVAEVVSLYHPARPSGPAERSST